MRTEGPTVSLALVIAAALFAGCPPPSPDKDPVVLVHGWGAANLGTMLPIKTHLVAAGWPDERIFIVDLTHQFDCIELSAQEVADVVDAILATTPFDKVDLVGHSMGGLVNRYYVKYMGGADKVRDFVSIATPNHGSITALGGLWSCSVQQMLTGSAFLAALNTPDETPGEIPYTALEAEFDEIVVPSTSAVLDGARNVGIPAFHIAILIHETAHDFVTAGLDGLGFNDN